MFYRVARYNIPIYTGYCKITVPLGAEPVGVLSDTVTTTGKTPLFICVNEPIVEGKDAETEELELLVVGDGTPYSGERLEGEDETLMYLGYAAWDNGYRIHHVFQVMQFAKDSDMNYTVTVFDAEDFINTLEEDPTAEIEKEQNDSPTDI